MSGSSVESERSRYARNGHGWSWLSTVILQNHYKGYENQPTESVRMYAPEHDPQVANYAIPRCLETNFVLPFKLACIGCKFRQDDLARVTSRRDWSKC